MEKLTATQERAVEAKESPFGRKLFTQWQRKRQIIAKTSLKNTELSTILLSFVEIYVAEKTFLEIYTYLSVGLKFFKPH